MTLDMEDLLNSIVDSVERIDCIKLDDIPDIDLYMDQVTTLIDGKLRSTTRNPGDDKILTKTMINNYTKNDLLPPPVKKKYTKEHMLELLFIFYFKSFLSIGDIQTLLSPLADELDGNGYNAERLYAQMIQAGKGARGKLKKDLDEKVEKVDRAFDDAPEEEREYLKKFSFICQLGYDIYLKKSIIEHMIDDMAEEQFLRETPDDK